MVRKAILATYRVECKKNLRVHEVARLIADRQSIGMWENPRRPTEGIDGFRASPVRITVDTPSKGRITVAFPVENLDTSMGNIPALLNYVSGDLFGYNLVEKIRLENIGLPKEVVRLFPGPKFGRDKIREILEVKEQRPIFGVVMKPSLGITPKYIAEKCLLSARKGADFITDDEKLVNPSYCTIDRRVKTVSKVLRRIESRYKKKFLYILNISHSANKIRSTAVKALPFYRVGLMVCFLTGGFGSIQALAEDSLIDAPIWAHRTMHAAFTRSLQHGISSSVIARLCRLVGADFQHVGPICGTDLAHPEHTITQKNIMTEEDGWFGLKPSFPVAVDGVHPGNVEATVKMLGQNIVFAVGTAIFNHPGGFEDGVTAMKQAIDAVVKGIPTPEYAKRHSELKAAMRIWGWNPPRALVSIAPTACAFNTDESNHNQ